MGDQDLPSIFGSISALKAVVPKSEGPRVGEIRADATLDAHLSDGLKGSHWRGTLSGDTVAVHVLRRRVTEVARVSFRESVDALVNGLRDKSAPGVLKPLSLAADRSAFTTRLCSLGTLADVTRTLDWGLGQKLIAIATVAEALEQLHLSEITHGALSPSAIVLDDDSSPWIAGANGTNLLIGTAGDSADPHSVHTYASPEAKFGEAIDPRSDIFSLGRVLYYLLTGKHRLPKDEDRARLDELGSSPAGLVRIVRKCTRHDPNDRYQTIDEFLADLVKYQKHGEVGTRHSGVEELEVKAETVDPLLSQFDRQKTKPVSRVALDFEPAEPEPPESEAEEEADPRLAETEEATARKKPGKPNQAVVAAGGCVVVAAIMLAFFGGEMGMIAGPILALVGVLIAGIGLSSGLKDS